MHRAVTTRGERAPNARLPTEGLAYVAESNDFIDCGATMQRNYYRVRDKIFTRVSVLFIAERVRLTGEEKSFSRRTRVLRSVIL